MKKSGVHMHTRNKEWATMFKSDAGVDTGMPLDEAVEIVLALAREREFEDEFEWLNEHAEACGVLHKMFDVEES